MTRRWNASSPPSAHRAPGEIGDGKIFWCCPVESVGAPIPHLESGPSASDSHGVGVCSDAPDVKQLAAAIRLHATG